jgi:ureidoglycolate lyase
MSMFSCFPKKLNSDGNLDVKLLERHPFTTQTFTPLGMSADVSATCFLVIVAPSLPDPLPAITPSEAKVQIQRPPDLQNLKAFVAYGGQAITYAVGTWHAPMVVVGNRRVDFVVTQFASGVAEEDCQEVTIGEGVSVQLGARQIGSKL